MFTPATASHAFFSWLYTKPTTFNGIWPWSWYMATTISYQPPLALENTVSGGTGPSALMPSAFAASIAGMISSISSLPNRPCSPLCGFRPATPILGSLIPRSLHALSAIRITSNTLCFFTRSQASRRETWVETWTTRRFSCASIMV